jgi:hypothetical protein
VARWLEQVVYHNVDGDLLCVHGSIRGMLTEMWLELEQVVYHNIDRCHGESLVGWEAQSGRGHRQQDRLQSTTYLCQLLQACLV